MRGYLVDTNIFLRLLTSDDPVQTPAVKSFVARVIDGKERAFVTTAVVLELVWTLESYFEVPRREVADKLSLLLNTPNLVVENRDIVEEAVENYRSTKIDFADCYNGAYASVKGEGTVLSYDRDFDKLPGVKRVEPVR